jgi:hypothetical protein
VQYTVGFGCVLTAFTVPCVLVEHRAATFLQPGVDAPITWVAVTYACVVASALNYFLMAWCNMQLESSTVGLYGKCQHTPSTSFNHFQRFSHLRFFSFFSFFFSFFLFFSAFLPALFFSKLFLEGCYARLCASKKVVGSGMAPLGRPLTHYRER